MISRSAAEFDASLTLLAGDLAQRAKSLRAYALTTADCADCRRARELVWLAFDAAFVGDRASAGRMLASAEEFSGHSHGAPRAAGAKSQASVVPGFEDRRPLVAASDAAYKGRCGGLGFVVSNGRYGMKRWLPDTRRRLMDPSGQSKVLVAELRAAAMAIKALGDGAGKASLLLDSLGAIAYLRAWQRGDVGRMPDGYNLRPRASGAKPTLVALAARVAKLPRLRIEHVKGHAGHPLNEAADALADIAMRSPEDRRERAEGIVEAFLKAWHAV
ncbi:ribonuclease HI [Herbidospora cretacea]|uniref:ribonuclease HI n=1 Tax=Herbidospora cretacea TaxID=28444 RepID=UPI0004C479A3|nr:RNase H family protein [Herbidospora cretacea]